MVAVELRIELKALAEQNRTWIRFVASVYL